MSNAISVVNDAFGHAARLRALRRGLRSSRRTPATREEALARVQEDVARRNRNFLAMLDDLVWSTAGSPYRSLLEHAGFEPRDVAALVTRTGIEASLEALRDEGVYISHAEWLGTQPVVRGSRTFQLFPHSFFNPRVPPDLMGSTSGTRSGGTSVSLSYANLRHGALLEHVRLATWDRPAGPIALWLPVLPAGAGFNTIVRYTAAGLVPQRWFSQIDPSTKDLRGVMRLATWLLPLLGRTSGVPLPRPQFAPAADPSTVLRWCRQALTASGAATVVGYASSMVSLCREASRLGARLDGLTVVLTGEPVTAAKAEAVRRSGATPVNRYAFMQFGGAAISCPHCEPDELHVWDNDVAVVDRRVAAPGGRVVPALLWTSLQRETRSVLLNVENDDYGVVERDKTCPCLLGELGCRTFVSGVRGMSKVVAAGITLRGDQIEQLVEHTLPSRCGGGPGDYQFVEHEDDGATRITLRVHPDVGLIDDRQVREAIADGLRVDGPGLLADEVWRGGDVLTILRAAPTAARSGKVLAYEVLRPVE